MTTEAEIKAIERNIEQAKGIQSLGKALERLSSNKDFKQIILQGYFKDEAVRLVHLKGDKNFESDEKQAILDKKIGAISQLVHFLNNIEDQADNAAQAIVDGESLAEVMRRELAEEGDE